MRNLFSDPEILFDAQAAFDPEKTDAQSNTAAFLLSLAGDKAALAYLEQTAESDDTAAFLLNSLGLIEREIEQAVTVPEFGEKLETLAKNPTDKTCLRNVFFPEGAGLPEMREARVQALREKRKVRISQLNHTPLSDPGGELLFTSNVLLTIPSANTDVDSLDYSDKLKAHIRKAINEEQQYWFDHPIQIGDTVMPAGAVIKLKARSAPLLLSSGSLTASW